MRILYLILVPFLLWSQTILDGDRSSYWTGGGGGGLPECEDYDGNTYTVVQIGNLYWTTENLRTTHYSDGTAIDTAGTNDSWAAKTDGAYCWYNNDSSTYAAAYGAMYNLYAVDSLLAPTGWRIPTDADWDSLEAYLGMTEAQTDSTEWRGSPVGTYLKGARDVSGGDGHPRWTSDGGGTDSVGFAGYPGGYRHIYDGNFYSIGFDGYWWSSTEYNANEAWSRNLGYNNSGVWREDGHHKRSGFSVRCVRDVE